MYPSMSHPEPARSARPHTFRSPAWLSRYALLAFLLVGPPVAAELAADPVDTQAVTEETAAESEPTQRPTLYVTATAHLDTQWLWTIQKTIDEYIPDTLHGNFARFDEFPNYTFSFEGSFRYMLMKEYYPEDYARLKEYVKQGRWHVCGSWVDACDVNVPAPESLVRHALYGNGYFKREFGKTSCDVYLPDCFGFGYALPSVAAHCGITGFSTQKLTWGSSIGIPFDVGVWEGVGGAELIAAVNPGAYVSKLEEDLSVSEEWLDTINTLGEKSGAYVGYKYVGVGDVGGAPNPESVGWLEKSIAGDGPIRVINRPADQLYRDLTPEQVAKLPRYKGEMLMTRHGTGCYTSMAALKRWNRKNELLADAAERAAVTADWLGGTVYPTKKLEEAWVRFLWHQFHDDLTGTSIPQAYVFSFNDEIIALNQFSDVLTTAVGTVARGLDTQATGVPLVVYNPLASDRQDVIEATVRFPEAAPKAVRVVDPSGVEVPSQITSTYKKEITVLFLGRVPSAGFAVFDVQPADKPWSGQSELSVAASQIENRHYRIGIDEHGDVASIFDKTTNRELLKAPARLELLRNTPDYWDEWEVRYEDVSAEPYAYADNPVDVKIVEAGPVRAAVEIVRHVAGSTVIQKVSLAAGAAGDRVVWDSRIDWHTPQTLLKAAFPLTAANATATYDLGWGVIERPNNTETKYEVPAQQWADLTAPDGSYGASIFSDCKYGWDKPNDDTLRLTLVHTPKEVQKDMGRHRMTYALAGHSGDWRKGNANGRAARLNQPLIAFQTSRHTGTLGKRLSLLDVSTPQVVVRAIKKAELSDQIIVRVQEADGFEAKAVRVAMAHPIITAREVSGAEEPVGEVRVDGGELTFDLEPFQPRTFAVKLHSPYEPLNPPTAESIPLAFDRDVVSLDNERSGGDFDGKGHSLPGELLPAKVTSGGIPFTMGPATPGVDNALSCQGQSIALPTGEFNRLYILAATTGEPADAIFQVGDQATEITVRPFGGWIGQSDSLMDGDQLLDGDSMAPGFIHRDDIAWVGTHRHDAATDRNEPYVFCYLFRYGMDIPKGASVVTLPTDDRIRIMAMTLARDPGADTFPAQPLYDRANALDIKPRGGLYIDPPTIAIETDGKDVKIFYTTDGTEPTTASTRYTGPFKVSETATIAAKAVRRGAPDALATRATFTFTEPREPDTPDNTTPGLAYRYYEGEWKGLPDFDELTPVKSGTTAQFDLTQRQRDDTYGFAFTGFVQIQSQGVYTFTTASDDGSRLYIGNKLIVENGGLHGRKEANGNIGLGPGMHRIRVIYFERGGDDVLEVFYSGAGIKHQPIPVEALFHVEADVAPPPTKQGSTTQPDDRLNWFSDARFGMFIHWGPVALKGTEIGWSRGNGVPIEEYDNLYRRFNPTAFDADAWVRIAVSAGMKYLVITSKHHDGFCLWPSTFTDYDITATPFKRDVLAELSEACKKHDLRFCVYYSICDWRHEDYPLGSPGGKGIKPTPNLPRYVEYMKGQLREIIEHYGPLGVVWFDGEWEKPWTHEYGDDLYGFLRNLQPDLIINNRVGKGREGMAGTTSQSAGNPGDFDTPEQQIGGFNRDRPWETCMTICRQWAWKPDDQMKPLKQCIQTLVRTVGGDGNLLFNVGPMPDGRIEPRQVDRLSEMGDWLAKYGKSIYGTRGGPFKPSERGVSTCSDNRIYLHVLDWTDAAIVLPPLPNRVVGCTLLTGGDCACEQDDDGIRITVPAAHRRDIDTIVVLELDGPAEAIGPIVWSTASIPTPQ